MDSSGRGVRRFDSAAVGQAAIRLGDREIAISPGVEQADGRGFSAYSAVFGRGEQAPLPAAYEEVWVVLRGRLRIRNGDRTITATAGDYLHVPENSPGEVEAIEETALVCVSVPAH